MANEGAKPVKTKAIWEFVGKISAFLLLIGTIYAVIHIFPPGNAIPLTPSSFAVVRGMGNFTSDHIVVPIEWRNSGGQPTLIRNPTLFLINITDPYQKLSDEPELTYELAGELKDYSKTIGYVGESYTLKRAYVIDPNTITPTVMVFHIHDWWGPNRNFQFNKPNVTYGVILNYSTTSFSDIFGREETDPYGTFIFNMPIRVATVKLENDDWDSYSTYASPEIKHWLPFWK